RRSELARRSQLDSGLVAAPTQIQGRGRVDEELRRAVRADQGVKTPAVLVQGPRQALSGRQEALCGCELLQGETQRVAGSVALAVDVELGEQDAGRPLQAQKILPFGQALEQVQGRAVPVL